MKFKGYSDETLLAQLKGRFSVSYRIAADEQTALEMAKSICVEQTVEFPAAHIECDAIHSDIIGRLEQFEACEGGYRALISYSDQSATEEFAQFFNVVFGNSSLLPGITVERDQPVRGAAGVVPRPEIRRGRTAGAAGRL